MKYDNIPPFDALESIDGPTDEFGPISKKNEFDEAMQELKCLAKEAATAIADIFKVDIHMNLAGMIKLDEIIRDMWKDDWNPEKGDINLFTSHYGALLSVGMLEHSDAIPIFRSKGDLSHFSIWSKKNNREYFPFHKAYKCFLNTDGESLSQMYADLFNNDG